ncbi:putative 2OG-Fe(II) oxygenase [Phenylobacterium aquaticum]|uniref:putative 2OG-Fe(II) oxygenase n=1 Tax=Phenylobacterium aquaticum TaxID=1763816 RepID=UPI0026EBDB0D|nr:putative 2OG-Fe(II) oxygenase [Phenylobacterium aquaticum]
MRSRKGWGLSKTILDEAAAQIAAGRFSAALAATDPLLSRPDAIPRTFALHAAALKGLGRRGEAAEVDREAVRRFPQSRIAWHNLGATLGDLGRATEAIAALETAFRLGLDAPETWLVQSRALVAAGRLDEGEAALGQALRRRPAELAWSAELANLVWMRRGDLSEALAVLAAAERAGAPGARVRMAQADLMRAAGQHQQAWALLRAAADQAPGDGPLGLAASQAAMALGLAAEAETLARRAHALAPGEPAVLNQLCIVALAQGRPSEALEAALSGLKRAPANQSLWGWAAVAARQAGDPLHATLCDHDGLVRIYDLPTPEGWNDMAGFLSDLDRALSAQHLYVREPTNQSVRQGSQISHLLTGSDDPAIQAAFRQFAPAIDAYVQALGPGADPLRSRNTGAHQIHGAWSVLLGPGGSHSNHLHMEGWISSVFYVATPRVIEGSARHEGWLSFGEPPIALDPPCPPERFVEPRPGRLVLFPSYMWHGVIPFSTDGRRLTMAFDVTPA